MFNEKASEAEGGDLGAVIGAAAISVVDVLAPSLWDRRSFIEKGGWATTPGADAPNSAVVTACAERLGGSL